MRRRVVPVFLAAPCAVLALLSLGRCGVASADLDTDGDGTNDVFDCAPNDASIHPGASEACDQIDNNCNGAIDEGVTATWYADRDGDGFGSPEDTQFTCAPAADFVANSGDCDDADARVHEGAPELCDGKDSDCNGRIDEIGWTDDFALRVNSASWRMFADAEYLDLNDISWVRLTGTNHESKGALWRMGRQPGGDFELRFKMRLNGGAGESGDNRGEGLAVVLSTTDTIGVIGRLGKFLGIYGEDLDGFVVEFDNKNQGAQDARGGNPHIAAHRIRDGYQFFADRDPPGFTGDTFHDVAVRVIRGKLQVDVDGNRSLDRLLPGAGTSSGYSLGFTATTSGLVFQSHDLDEISWGCPDYTVIDTPTDTGL